MPIRRYPLVGSSIALWGWVFLVAVVSVKSLFKPQMHAMFPGYWQAGAAWWLPSESRPADALFTLQYGPIFGQIMAPFVPLPLPLGGLIWFLSGISIFLGGLIAFDKCFLSNLSPQKQSWFYFLVPMIGFGSIYNAQVNLAIAGLLLLAAVFVIKERWWLAAFCVALPACLKVYPLAMGLIFLALFPRRMGLRLPVAILSLLLLPFAFHPFDVVIERTSDWLAYLASGERYTHPGWNNFDARTLMGLWGLDFTPAEFLCIQAGAGLIVLSLVLRYRSASDRPATILYAYRISSVYLILFGPASEMHTYLLVSPTLVGMMMENWENRSFVRRWSLVGAFVACGPLYTTVFGRDFHEWVKFHQIAPLGLSIVFVWLAADAMRARRSSTAHSASFAPMARAA